MTLHEELRELRIERQTIESAIAMASNRNTCARLERKLSAIDRSIDRVIDYMQHHRHEGIIS